MFGFGGSSGRSSSQSSSLDLGFNTSSSLSESLGRSQSTSQSFTDALAQQLARSGGSSSSTQNVWNADVLKRLYGDAIGAAGDVDTGLFQGQAAQLFNSGASILDTLGVGAGEDYLQSRLTDTSARDAQLDVLEERMGQLFTEEINPAITARHVAGGTLGGGRQGVAQAQGAQRVAREFAAGASDILSRDQASRDSAAAALMQGRTAAAGVGAQLIPGLAGVAQAGLGAPLSPYSTLASILGGPLALTTAESSQFGESSGTSTSTGRSSAQATSEDVARAISEALGFNYGTSQSTSSSKSKSFNFGLSPGG